MEKLILNTNTEKEKQESVLKILELVKIINESGEIFPR